MSANMVIEVFLDVVISRESFLTCLHQLIVLLDMEINRRDILSVLLSHYAIINARKNVLRMSIYCKRNIFPM